MEYERCGRGVGISFLKNQKILICPSYGHYKLIDCDQNHSDTIKIFCNHNKFTEKDHK